MFCAGKELEQVELQPGQSLVLGRGAAADIRIRDLQASRRHTILNLDSQGALRVEDLGSHNGTLLDDVRVDGTVDADPPCTLKVGQHRLQLTRAGEDAQIEEPERVWDAFGRGRLLGEGAFGRVYAAERKRDGWQVAIKEISLLGFTDQRERFLREARLCEHLDDPNVVRVHEVRVEGDVAYQIMERIPGAQDLRDMLEERDEPVPIAEVVTIGLGIARGLAAIHRTGVVHRDIKPANVMVTPVGSVKITDFGLARRLESGETLTQANVGMGTLAYVPPEQADDARRAQPTSDLYSLGAVLYHLLTDEAPFSSLPVEDLLEAIGDRDPVPLETLRPDCPAALLKVVNRLMDKDADARYANAKMTVKRLERVLQELEEA